MRLDNPQQQRQLVTWALNQVVRVIDELPQEEEEEQDMAVGRVTCFNMPCARGRLPQFSPLKGNLFFDIFNAIY